MTDKQIIKLNELTEMSQELGLYEDRPDWRITLQADHIKRLEAELKAKEQECEELKRQRQSDKGLITATGKMNYELLQEYDKLKTVLTEIKEIAEAESYLSPQSTRLLVHKILQKISDLEV